MIQGYFRALYSNGLDRLFAVIGNGFYEIMPDKTNVLRGTLTTPRGNCSISENETQIIITDGINGYIFTYSDNSFVQITDPAYPTGTHVINLDGFFIQNESNSGRFWWSKLRDGTIWDGLQFATAEGSPDNLLSFGKSNGELWLFGSKSTEIWYDTGNNDSQFQRINQGFIDIGIDAPWSVATSGNSILWLGGSALGHGIVWMASNYQPQRISTHAIEYIIEKLPRTDDAIAYIYQQEGHVFYMLTFPSGDVTLCYDLKTNMWHKRGAFDLETGHIGRHRGNCFAFWQGKNYVGDYANSNLYELDLETYTDNGNPIKIVRVGPHIHHDRKRLFFHEFELDIERGVGLVSGQGSNPKITLNISNDGGKTYGNDIQLSMGRIGKTTIRAHKHRLGYSRDRVFKMSTTDPVPCAFIAAHADIEVEGGV